MNERISRLMDGEIDAAEFDGVCAMLKGDAAMATWIVLPRDRRRAARRDAPLRAASAWRFAARLAAEPTVLAPRDVRRCRARRRGPGPPRRRSPPSPSSAGRPAR